MSTNLAPYLPVLLTTLFVGAVLWLTHIVLIARHSEWGNEKLFPRQLLMLGLSILGVIAIALSLPVSDSARNQIITLIGLIVSGVFAFSSSTIFANLMAGIMLRVTRPFRTGDFIRVGEDFGRVVERGLLDTEIQTEQRELVSIPNTSLISRSVSVTQSSGAVVSCSLTLGYDIHHAKAEALLLQAAEESGLTEPFVQILELGNYSITYKVSGLLADVKSLLSARSNLFRHVLDTLHGNQLEIMSPAFMNQRKLADDAKAIPTMSQQLSGTAEQAAPEAVVFDKAEQAERQENNKQQLLLEIERHKGMLRTASAEQKLQLESQVKILQQQLSALEQHKDQKE